MTSTPATDRSTPAAPIVRGCRVPSCDDRHWAKGMCRTHYMRAYRGTPLEPESIHSGATHKTRVSPWRFV
jgi:hypothetical protein